MDGKPEEVHDSLKSQENLKERLAYNQFCNPSPGILLPDLPPEISQLLQVHNRDLGLEYWGLTFAIWISQPFFPLRRGTFRKNLSVRGLPISSKKFQQMLWVLSTRKVIKLRYPLTSPWFDAVVLTPGRTPQELDWKLLRGGPLGSKPYSLGVHQGVATPQRTPGELTGYSPENPGGVGVTPRGSSPIVGVDLKKTSNNVTANDVRLAIGGDAWTLMMRLVPGFQAGHLIPHLRDAQELYPEDPAGRLRGAIFYLSDSITRGSKVDQPFRMLRYHLQQGHFLETPPDLAKKRPSNAKTENPEQKKQEHEENERFLSQMARHSFEQMKAYVTGHFLYRDKKKQLLEGALHSYARNPNLAEFKAWAEKEAV